jgi:8-oxo-dGTP diphosphatase
VTHSSPTPIAIAVVRRDGHVLVGRRSPGAALAVMLEFPGGKVRPGETWEQAAARECHEETGLAVEVGPLLDSLIHEYPHGRLELRFFDCRPLELTNAPRAPFAWTRMAELTHDEFPPANAGVLRMLRSTAGAGDNA